MKRCVCGREPDEKEFDRAMTLIQYSDMDAKKKELIQKSNIRFCFNCAERQVLDEMKKRFKPVIEEFSKMVNLSGYDSDGMKSRAIMELFFSEHRYLQSEMLNFLRHLLKLIGSKKGDLCWTDQRNDWMVRWAKAAADVEVE